jgi:hypothetical protein
VDSTIDRMQAVFQVFNTPRNLEIVQLLFFISFLLLTCNAVWRRVRRTNGIGSSVGLVLRALWSSYWTTLWYGCLLAGAIFIGLLIWATLVQ